MDLHSPDPAFPFEIEVLNVSFKEGDLTDKETKEKRHYQSFVVQGLWRKLSGGRAQCLAKPVNGWLPDSLAFKEDAKYRLAVTSASSSGGQLNVRFSGFELVK